MRTLQIFLLLFFSLHSFGQSEKAFRLEKRLYSMCDMESYYNLRANYRRCQRIAKRRLKNKRVSQEEKQVALFYTALSYSGLYTDYLYLGKSIDGHVSGNIQGGMDYKHPGESNNVDSAIRYTSLYIQNFSGDLNINKKWRENLYPDLIQSIVNYEVNLKYAFDSLWVNRVSDEGREFWKWFGKEEPALCNQLIGYYDSIVSFAESGYAENKFTRRVDAIFVREKLGCEIDDSLIALSYADLVEYYDFVGNRHSSDDWMIDQAEREVKLLEFLAAQKPEWLLKFVQFVEKEANRKASISKNVFEYLDNQNYWQVDQTVIDLGVILINDSIRNLKNDGYDGRFSVNFKVPFHYSLDSGDNIKDFQVYDSKSKFQQPRLYIGNLIELNELHGDGEGVIMIYCYDDPRFYDQMDRENEIVEVKVKRELTISNNRGYENLTIAYILRAD